MKRAPIKDLTELSSLRQQLKVREEQEKIAEQQRLLQERAAQREANVFKSQLGGVTPIKAPDIYVHQRAPIVTKATPAKPKDITSMSEAMQVMEQWSDEFDASQWQEDDDEMSYSVAGSSPDVLRKLRKGQWPAQAYLDLHGLQRDQARSALADFLRRSKHARLRSVCVIHGKGINSRQPAILPSKVRSWLCQSEWVQAFCQANAADGGDGAVHVLLINERQ